MKKKFFFSDQTTFSKSFTSQVYAIPNNFVKFYRYRCTKIQMLKTNIECVFHGFMLTFPELVHTEQKRGYNLSE